MLQGRPKREQEQALIDRHIAADPHGRGPADARLADYGTPVWAIVGYLPAVGGDPVRVAEDYEVPLDAVRAALAYYRRHRALIDARLAANAAAA